MKTEYTILRMIETMRMAKWQAWCQLPERRPALQSAKTRCDLTNAYYDIDIAIISYAAAYLLSYLLYFVPITCCFSA